MLSINSVSSNYYSPNFCGKNFSKSNLKGLFRRQKPLVNKEIIVQQVDPNNLSTKEKNMLKELSYFLNGDMIYNPENSIHSDFEESIRRMMNNIH